MDCIYNGLFSHLLYSRIVIICSALFMENPDNHMNKYVHYSVVCFVLHFRFVDFEVYSVMTEKVLLKLISTHAHLIKIFQFICSALLMLPVNHGNGFFICI